MKRDVYFFWESDHLPWTHYLAFYSFRKWNPDWRIFLVHKKTVNRLGWATGAFETRRHDENFFDQLPSLNVNFLNFDTEFPQVAAVDTHLSYLHARDLVAWKVLEERGGFFSDTDILFLRSADDLAGKMRGKKIGLTQFAGAPKAGYIPVSFMAGDCSGFFSGVFERAVANYNPDRYECCGAEALGDASLNSIEAAFPGEVLRIPEKTVFPFAGMSVGKMLWNLHHRLRAGVLKGPLGLHYYNGLVVRKYDRANFHDFKNTLTEAMRLVWDKGAR